MIRWVKVRPLIDFINWDQPVMWGEKYQTARPLYNERTKTIDSDLLWEDPFMLVSEGHFIARVDMSNREVKRLTHVKIDTIQRIYERILGHPVSIQCIIMDQMWRYSLVNDEKYYAFNLPFLNGPLDDSFSDEVLKIFIEETERQINAAE